MKLLLDPESTRREGILARPIVLADGLEWSISLPSRLIRPRILASIDSLGRPVDFLTVEIGFGYPLFIRRSIDRLREACEGGSLPEQYESFLSLAAALLIRAHDIDLPTACRLLTVTEEDLIILVNNVMSIIKINPIVNGFDESGVKSE